MTLNDRYIKKSSLTPTPAHTALKKVARVAVVFIGAVVCIPRSISHASFQGSSFRPTD